MDLRIIIASTKDQIENQFNNRFNELQYQKNFNGYPGSDFLISKSNHSDFEKMSWGIPNHSTVGRVFTVNSKRIITNASYRAAIKMHRCLIPANCISVKIKEKRYILFSARHRLFGLAGIYFRYHNLFSFALLIREANFFFSRNGLKEEPLIISPNNFLRWHGKEFSSLLNNNDEDDQKLDGYQIKNDIDFITLNSKELIQPIGLKFSEIERKKEIEEKMNFTGLNRKNRTSSSHWGDEAMKQNKNREKNE